MASHIYNNLSLYIWQGQANEIPIFAPWINPATININPCIGGGGVQQWFKIGYLNTVPVTFHEVGLPSGVAAEWGVHTGFGGAGAGINATVDPAILGNATVGAGGKSITLNLPATSKIAYAPVVLAQPHPSATWYNFSNASVPSPISVGSGPMSVAVLFTALGNVSVTESGLATTTFSSPTWCAMFTSTHGANGPLPVTDCHAATGPPTTITQALASGTYTMLLSTSPGWAFCTETSPHVAQNNCVEGTVHVKSTTQTVPAGGVDSPTVVFYPVFEAITFHETGLPTGDAWQVSVSNFTASGTPYSATVTAIAPGSIVFSIQQNASAVYAFNVTGFFVATGFVPSISAGYFQPSAAKTISLTFMDPHRGGVILYSPEAVRRTESLPAE